MKPGFSFWLLGLLFIAFALRLFQLDAQSIWWDEGISLHLATSEIPEIVRDRLNNIHPPLYFLGLKSWLWATGVSAFNARYFSVLAGWLQVAVIFAIARRWFSLRTAYVAGILATFSAVSVIYSQEIRVYALLPLIYLSLLAITRELTRPSLSGKIEGSGLWISLGLATWIGLHLHYITLFILLYVAAWALILFIKQKRWLDLRHWFLTQFLVLLASLPWFVAVINNWSNVKGEANAGTFVADPVPLRFLIMQVWTFHLTGLAGMLARPGARTLAFVILSVLFILLLMRLIQKETRRDTVTLLSHWLVPLSSALIVWTVRSFSHPRYVAIFVPGLLMLTAFLIIPSISIKKKHWTRVTKVLSGLLFLGLLIASIWGLLLYFFDSNVAKDDMRGVAHYLEDSAKATDLILVPDTDWSLPFEYAGDTVIEMPRLDDPDGGWSHLESLSENTQRLFVVDYLSETRDWQSQLTFALKKAGTQVANTPYEGLVVRTYELKEPIAAPRITPMLVNYEPLVLNGIWIEQDEGAGDAVAVALSWQLSKPIDDGANVTLRLLDEEGWLIASTDTLLRDRYGRPSDQWKVGEIITTYHVIEVPRAIPPLSYELRVQVYLDDDERIHSLDILDEKGAPSGQASAIGTVNIVYKPPKINDHENLPIVPQSEPLMTASGLTLLAAEVGGGVYAPGDDLRIQLLWQAGERSLTDLQPEVVLVQESGDLSVSSGAPAYGHYPTNLWSVGEMVHEHRKLNIPATASGEFQIVLRLGESEVVLDEIEVISEQHNYEIVPVAYEIDANFGDIARLTGFNILKEQFSSGESVPLELVWQSSTNGSADDYVVFAHILAEDGRLIGQHDSPPANGARRVTGWLIDEYVVDHHEMILNENYYGQASLEVGIYDPLTGNRVLLPDGSDHLILPVTINFAPAE